MGDILVAERTDPGWIMLFPCAAGLLVERGSLLSHSAIVAREMGIPAIVSVDGVTRWLSDGDWVELNGSTGVVVKIPSRQQDPSNGK
jgi:pyruvate,water dikinase